MSYDVSSTSLDSLLKSVARRSEHLGANLLFSAIASFTSSTYHLTVSNRLGRQMIANCRSWLERILYGAGPPSGRSLHVESALLDLQSYLKNSICGPSGRGIAPFQYFRMKASAPPSLSKSSLYHLKIGLTSNFPSGDSCTKAPPLMLAEVIYCAWIRRGAVGRGRKRRTSAKRSSTFSHGWRKAQNQGARSRQWS